jgi:hypothetical protein
MTATVGGVVVFSVPAPIFIGGPDASVVDSVMVLV